MSVFVAFGFHCFLFSFRPIQSTIYQLPLLLLLKHITVCRQWRVVSVASRILSSVLLVKGPCSKKTRKHQLLGFNWALQTNHLLTGHFRRFVSFRGLWLIFPDRSLLLVFIFVIVLFFFYCLTMVGTV